MLVGDDLAGVTPGGGEANAVDDVVEPSLEQAKQVKAGDAGHLCGAIEVESELSFEQEVDPASALLGAKLDAIVGDLATAHLGVHAGRHGAPVERALGETLLAFQKELDAFAAAVAADGALVLTH